MKPRFGDIIENKMASMDNPTRVGTFVRVVRRTGRMNPGTWWEVTDGKGEFWLTNPANCERREVPSPLDLAQGLWCAVKRCHCSKPRVVDMSDGERSIVVGPCQCCSDDLAKLEELGYVKDGKWLSP